MELCVKNQIFSCVGEERNYSLYDILHSTWSFDFVGKRLFQHLFTASYKFKSFIMIYKYVVHKDKITQGTNAFFIASTCLSI